ncbi:hypothetical protein [uncultured Croceitalea sp.]|uniref:ATP-grasp domain-containing protein n=1 Tax=uncultured Croceitalea sp. TaxID=1798908 RepID=UPI003305F76F
MFKKQIDITILTESRYIDPVTSNSFNQNILLEDGLIIAELEKQGLNVVRVAWDDPNFDWSTTKYALFRATWDYFERMQEFSNWMTKTAQHTNFINSKSLIDWNIDKHYLKDLQIKGVNMAKTLFIEKGEELSLKEAMDKAEQTLAFSSDELVLKPCIAGGARHTYKFHIDAWPQYDTVFQELSISEAQMLQEFQKNVVDKGEVSMMLFNGEFTHAILKLAKKGDFRVQDDYGGTVHEYQATVEQIAFAKMVIDACPEKPLYARVDIFEDNDGKLALAELEIFEPELWFRFYPPAAKLFAKQLKELFT